MCRWAGIILQICLATAIRQTVKVSTGRERALLCKSDIDVFYHGTNESGHEVFDQVDFEPEEYDIMGGKTIFYKFSSNETEKPTRYMIGCDWASKIPVLMSIKEPDENGEGGDWSIGRFYDWHVAFQIRLQPGERVEFAIGTFEYNIFTSGRFTFRDGTGLWYHPEALVKATREQEVALTKAKDGGAKLCTQTVLINVKGTTHTGPNRTAVMKGIQVKFAPKEYMRVGGLKIMRKYVPGEVNPLSMRFEKLPALQEKRYFIRCNYDNGSPFLIMHEQGGGYDTRPFDIWHLWKREVSITEKWRLDFLADFAIPFEVSNGNVVLTLEDAS